MKEPWRAKIDGMKIALLAVAITSTASLLVALWSRAERFAAGGPAESNSRIDAYISALASMQERISNLEASVEKLSNKIDTREAQRVTNGSSAMSPVFFTPAGVHSAPRIRLGSGFIGLASGELSERAVEYLALDAAEVASGNGVLRQALEDLRKVEAAAVVSRELVGDDLVIKVRPYLEQSSVIIGAAMDELRTKWDSESVEHLKTFDPMEMFVAVAGAREKCYTIGPSKKRSGAFSLVVTESDAHSTRKYGTDLSTAQLVQLYGRIYNFESQAP